MLDAKLKLTLLFESCLSNHFGAESRPSEFLFVLPTLPVIGDLELLRNYQEAALEIYIRDILEVSCSYSCLDNGILPRGSLNLDALHIYSVDIARFIYTI
jgi:hypothetical protein